MARREKPIIFRLSNKLKNPSLKGKHYPGVHEIPGITDIEVWRDPEGNIVPPWTKKNNRPAGCVNSMARIRFLANEKTIFEEEQTLDPGKRDSHGGSALIFYLGEMLVFPRERTKLQFMRYADWNKTKEGRDALVTEVYHEVDTTRDARKYNAKRQLINKSMGIMYDAAITELLPYASVRGIHVLDHESREDEIRAELSDLISNNPEDFLNSFKDENIKVHHLIKRGVQLGIISSTATTGMWVWLLGDKKPHICRIGSIHTNDPEQALLDHLLSSDADLDQLKKSVLGKTLNPA